MESEALRARYRGQDVLVLGASGFLGRWIARELTRCGARLRLAVRDEKGALATFEKYGVAGEVVTLDLARPRPALAALFEQGAPDIVFNLAGYGVDRGERDEQVARRINAELPAVLSERLAAARSTAWTGLRLVHVGSALEYGALRGALTEQSVPNPTTLYGASKLAGTEAVLLSHSRDRLAAVVARLFTVYGPGEHEGRLLPSLLEIAKAPRALPLTQGLQRRDFTYVEDVAHGLLRLGLLAERRYGVVNLASGVLTSVRQFVETAATELDIPAEHLQFGALPVRAEEMEHDPVSTARLHAMIEWVPPADIHAGVARTRDFLRRAGG